MAPITGGVPDALVTAGARGRTEDRDHGIRSINKR